MLGQTPMPDENHQLPLRVEADQTPSSPDVASGRNKRFLWMGLGFACIMLIGLLAPENVIMPKHHFAFTYLVPGTGLRGATAHSSISQPVGTIEYPVYKRRVGPRMSLVESSVADVETRDTSTQAGLITEVHSLDDFNRLVAGTSVDDSILVVKFYYEGCAACRAMAPRFAEFVKAYAGKKIRFAEVEVMHNKDVAKTNGVKSAPSVHFYVDSKKVEDFVCVRKKVDVLKNRLDDYNQNGIAAIAQSTMYNTDMAA